MRIGILTFHAAQNYGAVLQCYALQTFLTGQGHKVSVIDYRNERLLEGYKCFSIKRIKRRNLLLFCANLVKEICYYLPRKKRTIAFNDFISSKLNLESTSSIVSNPYDLIIVGSDQVWNKRLTFGYDPFYWGDFTRPALTKLVSYAASMQDLWPDDENSVMAEKLKHFSWISVRENTLQKKLQLLTDNKIYHVVDPTLLLSSKEWSEIATRPRISEPYLLLYQVDSNDHNEEVAQYIAKKRGLKLVCLSAEVADSNTWSLLGASPSLFVGLFKYADFVVCSSFHGTVFSLLFRRPFFTMKNRRNNNSRVYSLLSSLALENHIIEDYVSIEGDFEFDSVKFDAIIKESLQYIKYITESE